MERGEFRLPRFVRRVRGGAASFQRGRFRRLDNAPHTAVPGIPRRPRTVQGTVPLHHGRRIPGHEPPAVRVHATPCRQERRGRGRRRPVHLLMARRGLPEHREFREGLPEREGNQARAELPLDGNNPGGGERRHPAQHEQEGEEALERQRRGKAHRGLLPGERGG